MWNKAKLRIETQSSCMTPTLPKVGTQKRKLYDALIAANGDWVNGRYFLRELYLSQYHRAIWELENAPHFIKVEHSPLRRVWL
jgi:hypothetical protein